MNRFVLGIAALATSVVVVAANAQPVTTTQASVVGASGVSTYSVRVVGADGQRYNCRPNIVDVAGTPTRFCRNARAATGAPQGGQLLGGSLTAGGVAAAIGTVALIVALSDDSSATTTTGN